jgi:hypothetical protein
MGRPSNGTTNNGAGPSGNGNGHAPPSSITVDLLDSIKPIEYGSRLMYEDDADWAEHQAAVEEGMDAIGGIGGISGESSQMGARHGKRMPVDREEFVRLVLQGLRDIGYE